MITRLQLVVIVVVGLLLAGFGIGWYIFRPTPPPPEVYAPPAVQKDGSIIVEKKPSPTARPKAEVPKDAKVERIVRFEVRPLELPPLASLDGAGALETSCPSLDMEMSLVRLPDESRRVVLKSDRGEVLNAVDIPVEAAKPYKELKWAAGVSYNPMDNGFGGWVDRDLGPFRLGAEVNQIKGGFDARIKAGLRF